MPKDHGRWDFLKVSLIGSRCVRPLTTGLGRNVLYVDIESPGEVINVLVCGTADTNNMRVQVLDPFGATVYDNTAVGNVACNDDFDHTFDPATA